MANYRAMTRRAAVRHGLDPDIFERQIGQESGFAEDVITGRRASPAGALGIAQIMPATARSWGVNPLNPRAALESAAAHMASYVRQFGNYADALRAYNAGPGAVQASHGYAETNNYVRSILGGRNPTARRATDGAVGATRTTTTTRTPGIDNSRARGELVASFLRNRGTDPLDFALQFRQLKDVPGTATTRTRRRASQHGRIGSKHEAPIDGSEIKELIFNDGGSGYGIKNGAEVDGASVYSVVWAGHRNHVHVAAGPRTVVALGRIAQQMGLHVGENSHFGGVGGGHVPNSYHNRDEAIDVSGDPAKMAAFARYVRRYSRGH